MIKRQIYIEKQHFHICKKNFGYIYVFSADEVEYASIFHVKLTVPNYVYVENEMAKEFHKAEEEYENAKKNYEIVCEKRLESSPLFFDEKAQDLFYDRVIERLNSIYGPVYNRNIPSYKLKEKMTDEEKNMTFMRHRPVINEQIDIIFAQQKKAFEHLSEQYYKLEDAIIRFNNEKLDKYQETVKNAMDIWAKDFFEKYKKEHNLSDPKEDVFCKQCNKSISYSNWSKHTKSVKHVKFEELKIAKLLAVEKVQCECGSKVLARNMETHKLTPKHVNFVTGNKAEEEKVECGCGAIIGKRYMNRHILGKQHQDYIILSERQRRYEEEHF